MVERPKDELLDHEYDGIREFDNPCPAWWHLIFLGSVVFSVFYWAFFGLGPSVGKNGWTPIDAFKQATAANLQLQFGGIELSVDEATILDFMYGTFVPPADPEDDAAEGSAAPKDWLAIGANVFETNCKSCHADDGSGLVGPNLTDDHYKNVKQLIDIARVIENGAAANSMPAWQNRLDSNQIVLVSAYVANMRGKNLSGPRPPEGNVIPPWPTSSTDAATQQASAQESSVTEQPSEVNETPAADETESADETPAAEVAPVDE